MNPKAGEYRCSELSGLDIEISPRYHWSVARQLTSYSLCHWNLRNLTIQQECYLTNTRDFFCNTHGSIMLLPRQPRVFARLGSLAMNEMNALTLTNNNLLVVFFFHGMANKTISGCCSALFHCTFHAWVGWLGEIKYGLITAARGALTS